jgi:translation elongation factor EF-1alpha
MSSVLVKMVLIKQFLVGVGSSVVVSAVILNRLTERRRLIFAANEMDESQFTKIRYEAVRRLPA